MVDWRRWRWRSWISSWISSREREGEREGEGVDLEGDMLGGMLGDMLGMGMRVWRGKNEVVGLMELGFVCLVCLCLIGVFVGVSVVEVDQ